MSSSISVEFLAQGGAQLVVDLAAEIGIDAGPGQIFEVLLRGLARRHRLVRILVFELVERERNAPGKAHGFRDRLGQFAKQPRHFAGRLQVTLGIGFQPAADRVDRRLLADAGQHVLQPAAGGMVVQHLVGREQRHLGGERQTMQPRQPAPVVAAIDQAGGEPDAIGPACLQPLQKFLRERCVKAMRQRQHQELAFGKIQQIVEPQMAVALFDPSDAVAAFAPGQQLAQPAIGGAVARIDQDVWRAVDEDDPCADQKFGFVRDVGMIQLLPGADHAGQRVVVGDADDGDAECTGLMHIGARIRTAAQEREIADDADLGIAGRGAGHVYGTVHANSPCMNQRGGIGSPSASSSSP